MKFLKKADETYSLKNLFNEHLNKFSIKHEQELGFLEDVRNFIQKKSQIELQYSQALSKLCQQYLSRSEYQIASDTKGKIYIPEKWKMLIEQYAYIAEKKQVSSKSLLHHCDYFRTIRDQKNSLNLMAVNYLKKIQQTLSESHQNCENAFKAYCYDQMMCDQLSGNQKKYATANLEKKLKKRKINPSKFRKSLDELIKDGSKADEKKKKVDFSRLNYVTSNCCQNQQLQYYFSMEIPQLLQLQNGNIDYFIDECLNSLIFKEIDTSRFLVKQLEDGVLHSVTSSAAAAAAAQSNGADSIQVYNFNSSENFFINHHDCFNNLIQFELDPYDSDSDDLEYKFQKENFKELSTDYIKWSNKLADLESLMQAMLEQVNEKRIALNQQVSDTGKLVLKEKLINMSHFSKQDDYQINQKLEEQRFLLAEKKLQMIQLQAKIDALGFFNINLKELEEYNSAAKFAERKREFDSDLYQNLELWDTLMKSIDEIHYSNESYDVDFVRHTHSSSSSTQSRDGAADTNKGPSIYYDPTKRKASDEISMTTRVYEPSVDDLRYAKTITSFTSESKEYLSYSTSQSLIIFDEITSGVFRAKNCHGQIGLVDAKNIEFYPGEDPIYVKSVYAYDGLDDQELTFPGECYIRLLRKEATTSDRKFADGEEWWEGAYENKIGFFPAIFVQELGKFSDDKSSLSPHDDVDLDKTLEEIKNTSTSLSSPSMMGQSNETSLKDEIEKANLLSPENQQVPPS